MTELERTADHEEDRRVRQVAADVWVIPLPMCGVKVRTVNVYVIIGAEKVTLIDAGWDSEPAWVDRVAGLNELGASVEDVSACLVTHHHVDHIGLAPRLQNASGAAIGMHPAERIA